MEKKLRWFCFTDSIPWYINHHENHQLVILFCHVCPTTKQANPSNYGSVEHDPIVTEKNMDPTSMSMGERVIPTPPTKKKVIQPKQCITNSKIHEINTSLLEKCLILATLVWPQDQRGRIKFGGSFLISDDVFSSFETLPIVRHERFYPMLWICWICWICTKKEVS